MSICMPILAAGVYKCLQVPGKVAVAAGMPPLPAAAQQGHAGHQPLPPRFEEQVTQSAG